MKINRPLVPKFLKDAEHQLLTSHPEIWSTRAHLVIYYGLLFIAALAILSFVIPIDIRLATTIEYWVGFVSIISIIALIIWLIYLLRFNVFKRFGISGPVNRLTTFILYFISVGIIVLFSYVNPIVESIRANTEFGDEEIVQDVNNINIKICQVEYNLLNHKWASDTLLVVDSVELGKYYNRDEVDLTESSIAFNNHIRRIDTGMLSDKLKEVDSIVKLNDSLYVEYRCPPYLFVDPYVEDEHTKEKQLAAIDIYRNVIVGFKPPVSRERVRKELLEITDKYLQGLDTITYYSDADVSTFAKIGQRYHLRELNSSIGNVVSKKYRWNELPSFVYIFYYITLMISLLVFIFRHSTVKTFFLSLLAGVIISILTALVMAFGKSGGLTFLSCMIGYVLLFFIISLMIWKINKRTITTGIAINLFVFMVPHIPMLLTACYYQYLDWKYGPEYPDLLYNNSDYLRNLVISQIAGFILLLVLMVTYIHSAYRKWYALPEE